MKIGFSVAAISGSHPYMSKYALSLTQAFSTHAEQHQFVFFVLEGDLPLFTAAGSPAQVIPVPEGVRKPFKNFLWHQQMLPRLAREHQLDVLHVPNHQRMPWRSPCPTVTNLQPPASSDGGRPAFFDRVIARWLAERQNEIIVDSESARDEACARFGLPARNLSVVCNGIDHQRFFPGSREAAKASVAQNYGLDLPFFLYAAPFDHPGSNHVRLIEAFRSFKEQVSSPWQLVLAGAHRRGDKIIQDAISSSHLGQEIRCLGEVSDDELAELYRAAGVSIYPALHCIDGMAPIEAMACGCPVVGSNRGALGEILGQSAAAIDPEDSASILDQMRWMAEDAELRERLRSASLARAKCFQWQETVAGTLAVYGQAVEDSKIGRQVLAMAH